MKRIGLLLIALIGLSHLSLAWELEKNKDGIRVYTRKVNGYSVKEYKAYGTVNASRLDIARILTRVGDLMNWMPNVDESRVIDIVSPTKRIVYYTVDLPWPTDDRDVVLDYTVDTDDDKDITYIYMKENLTAKGEVDGFVRMKKASGHYKLTSIGQNKTKVEYQFLADPGGSLPSWLINMFIVDGPYDALQAIRDKVR